MVLLAGGDSPNHQRQSEAPGPCTPSQDDLPRTPRPLVAVEDSDDEDSDTQEDEQFLVEDVLPTCDIQLGQPSGNQEDPPISLDASKSRNFQSYPGIDAASVQSSGRSLSNVIGGTPFRKNPPPRNHPTEQSVKDHATLIMQAQGRISKTTKDYCTKEFESVPGASVAGFRAWIAEEGAKKTGVYAEGRWKLPQKPAKEGVLYKPFEKILNKLLNCFVRPHCGQGASRRVVDAHGEKLRHDDGHYTSPDLIVRATGSSFETPLTKFGYCDVATFFDVKLDGQLENDKNIQQLAVYARQIYAHQPNRKFVRGLLLSHARAVLVHYDHSGIQVSPAINIHDNPWLFVRIIASLCNSDEAVLGLDDSFQWKHDNKGRKKSGTLTMQPDGQSQPKSYNLLNPRPIANIVDIRGRATICWSVRDEESGEDLIVKDSWDSEGRSPEYLHLLKVKGSQGVCEVVWHSNDKQPRFETRHFRCSVSTTAGVDYYNRVASRIIMKAYGQQIHHFRSILELLEALRDAIAGHANIFGNEIVHRDISNMNVLLGRKGAEVGNRGILIDLGVAIDFGDGGEGESLISHEARTGSRFFQSCEVLDYLTDLAEGEEPPPHDYLDDLEGFFHLVSYCFFKHFPDGTERPKGDKAKLVVEGWDNEDPKIALDAKSSLFNPARRYKQTVLRLVGQSWGEACKILYKEFLEWVWDIQVEKGRLVQEYIEEKEELEKEKERLEAQGISSDKKAPQMAKESVYTPLFNQSNNHYVQVLKIFDKAIDSVIKSQPTPEVPRVINVFGLGASSGKRRRTKSIARNRDAPHIKVVCVSPDAMST